MTRYREGIRAVLPPNAAVHFTAVPVTNVVAPEGEKWDVVVIVKYENLEGFRKMVESEEYKRDVEPHRLAALEDFRLIMMDKVEV